MFFDQLRLEGARPIPGGVQLEAAEWALDRLGGASILTVGRAVVAQVAVQLRLHGGLGELLDQGCENAILAGEVVALTQGLDGRVDIKGRFGSCHLSSLFALG